MNPFTRILAASSGVRSELFELSAIDVGTEGRNVEKDFYVNLILDLLYNHRTDGIPINFKGGTSLSLAHGLINRFSEDIDITISRQALGALPDSAIEAARALSHTKHKAALDEISKVCGAYISGPLKSFFDSQLASLSSSAKAGSDFFRVEIDPSEDFKQNLFIYYRSVYPDVEDPYVAPRVKLEAGARGSSSPSTIHTVEPYINRFLPQGKIYVPNVDTLDPMRTFYEKLTAVHSFRQTMALKKTPSRLSRHYYDLHSMWTNPKLRERIEANTEMLDVVREYKLLLFYRKNENLHLATAGSLTAMPDASMRKDLERDYKQMSTMIFGLPPTFEDVMASVEEIETEMNRRATPTPGSGA